MSNEDDIERYLITPPWVQFFKHFPRAIVRQFKSRDMVAAGFKPGIGWFCLDISQNEPFIVWSEKDKWMNSKRNWLWTPGKLVTVWIANLVKSLKR